METPTPIAITPAHKNNRFLTPLLSLFVFIFLGTSGYLFYQNAQLQKQLVSLQTKLSPSTTTPPTPSAKPTTNWKTYINKQPGYSVKYSPSLNPTKEISNDNYLSLINFENSSSKKENFQISVRKSTLNEEVQYQKWTIEGHILTNLNKEENINFQNKKGVRLEYRSVEEEPSIHPFTIVIINNEKYSYTISSAPEQIDLILSTFKFTD